MPPHLIHLWALSLKSHHDDGEEDIQLHQKTHKKGVRLAGFSAEIKANRLMALALYLGLILVSIFLFPLLETVWTVSKMRSLTDLLFLIFTV